MSQIKRCTVCKGFKKIVGLGMVEKECSDCKGIGFIEVKEEPIVDNILTIEPIIIKKRPGRPKRVA
jgi:phage FluMu protein Com